MVDKGELAPNTSRRNILKLAVAAGTAALIGDPPAPKRTAPPAEVEKRVPGLPEDVLSPEYLKGLNVTISQGTETELYLRKSALDIPIFKDLQEGKTGGLEICLIDAVNLDWRKTGNFSPDARLVFDRMFGPDASRNIVRSEANWLRGVGRSMRKGMQSTDPDSAEYENFEQAAAAYEDSVIRLERQLEKPNDEFFEFYLNQYVPLSGMWPGNSAGTFISPEMLRHYMPDVPDSVKNKNYVFTGVTGYSPDPQNSYPNPEVLEKAMRPKTDVQGDYVFDRNNDDFKPKVPSFNLRHELAHYQHSAEDQADMEAYNSLKSAWEKLQQGDDSGYPFVFKNTKGITVAKNIHTESPINIF